MGDYLAWQEGLLQPLGTSAPLQLDSGMGLSVAPAQLLAPLPASDDSPPFLLPVPVAGASRQGLPHPRWHWRPGSHWSPGSHCSLLLGHSVIRHILTHVSAQPWLGPPLRPLLHGTPMFARSVSTEPASPTPVSDFWRLHPELSSAFCLRNRRTGRKLQGVSDQGERSSQSSYSRVIID